ncbi:MAG: aldo/keto reductase, partial [Trebonia sp.]
SRLAALGDTGDIDAQQGFRVIDVLADIAGERGVSIAQTAIRWLIQRPGVSSVIIGARTEEQLKDNLGAAGWELTGDEMARLDRVSARSLPYPYWHQQKFNASRMRYTVSGSGLGSA